MTLTVTTTAPARYPTNPDAPVFDRSAWLLKYEQGAPLMREASVAANCYQYAIAGSKPDGSNRVFNEAVPIPGDKEGRFDIWYTQQGITPAQLKELTTLDGLQWAADAQASNAKQPLPPAKPGYYIVGLYLRNDPPTNGSVFSDVHVIRQDSNGGWSEKLGADNHFIPQPFLPPAADGGYQELPTSRAFDRFTHDFAGYAYVPKDGIDGGMEFAFQRMLQEHHARGDKTCPAPIQSILQHLKLDPAQIAMFKHDLVKFNTPETVTAFDACIPTPATPAPTATTQSPER